MVSAPVRRLVVGAVIQDPAGRVLVARRTRPAALRGRYEFPGGKVEDGETPVEAIVREIAEELQVTFRPGEEIPGGPWDIGRTHQLRLWSGTIDTAPQPGESHDRVQWLAVSTLSGIDLLDSDTAALPWIERWTMH